LAAFLLREVNEGVLDAETYWRVWHSVTGAHDDGGRSWWAVWLLLAGNQEFVALRLRYGDSHPFAATVFVICAW